MEWVFGNTLICKDAESAKRVTFDKSVRMKSVTIDGDVYDPFGTLSGGSKPNSAGILVKVQELHEIRQQIKQHKDTLAKIDQELTNSKRVISDYKKRKNLLDLKTHEIHLLEEQLRQSTHSQVLLWRIVIHLYVLTNIVLFTAGYPGSIHKGRIAGTRKSHCISQTTTQGRFRGL
ncbi:SMCs flexible hinge [Umbelopsis sp. PMI_123]|nr:SMCs flexible hinge [Umbelopsis sp. PMI_123]